MKRARSEIVILLVQFFAVCLVSAGQPRKPPASERLQSASVLVVQGGLLIDGSGGVPVQDAVIVMQDSKILRAGSKKQVPVPSGATVINATGKTIIPGLMDSHVHLVDSELAHFLYWGVTTIGDTGNVPSWIHAQQVAVENGTVLGPSILMVGSGVDQPPRKMGDDSHQPITDERSMKAAILLAKRQGANAIKIYSGIPTPLIKYGVLVAHSEGLPVFSHYSSQTTGRSTYDIIDTGLDMHVHTHGLEKATVSKEAREQINAGKFKNPHYLMDSSKFPELAQEMVDRKMALNPTLDSFWVKVSKHLPEYDRINSAFWKGAMGAVLGDEEARQLFARAYERDKSDLTEVAQGYAKVGEFIRIFVAKGGRIVAGSDCGNARSSIAIRPPGTAIHVEMQMLREVGLTPMQVLLSATRWPAEEWRKGAEAGTIEPGKRADLVILNRNPLDDMAATWDIYRVIKNGQVVDREALVRWTNPLPPRPQFD